LLKKKNLLQNYHLLFDLTFVDKVVGFGRFNTKLNGIDILVEV